VYEKNDHKRKKKFQAYIYANDGKQISLGYFLTAEEAHEAYCQAASLHYGEYMKSG